MVVSEDVRRQIIDELLLIGNVNGQMRVSDFTAKVFPDVREMKSTDKRYSDAISDIAQHMDRNEDWDFEYLFGSYLKIYSCEEEKFLFFLEQYVNPVIRRKRKDKETECWEEIENSDIAECINRYLEHEGYKLSQVDTIAGKPLFKIQSMNPGVKGSIKNIIFASKYKPEIVFGDALNNDIEIVKNQDQCIIYDQPIQRKGLSWKDLLAWYDENMMLLQYGKSLEEMLKYSIGNDSPPENIFFSSYLEFAEKNNGDVPALLPQVYLYYDPKLSKERIKKIFEHQRMDFLLIISENIRIVIEIDGVQHYADANGKASVDKYAEMVEANREMTLAGYEVYRFGGKEFWDEQVAKRRVKSFLKDLFQKYGIVCQI